MLSSLLVGAAGGFLLGLHGACTRYGPPIPGSQDARCTSSRIRTRTPGSILVSIGAVGLFVGATLLVIERVRGKKLETTRRNQLRRRSTHQ